MVNHQTSQSSFQTVDFQLLDPKDLSQQTLKSNYSDWLLQSPSHSTLFQDPRDPVNNLTLKSKTFHAIQLDLELKANHVAVS